MVTPSLSAGGAERSVVLLSDGLQKRRHEVAVVTLHGAADDAFKLPAGVDRQALDMAGESRSALQGLRQNLRRLSMLRRALVATRPDIVVSHQTQTNVLTRLALTNTGCPLVMVEHSNPIRNTRAASWRMLRRSVYPRAATLVSVSHGIHDHFDWIPTARKAVIPNPVRNGTVQSPSSRAQGANSKRIVAMGRLAAVKGFDRLLLAFATLAPKYPDWQLQIMGEGEARSDLEKQIETLGLIGRVELPGFVSDPFTVLQNAALFAMTSRSEGFPYALLEAMSCGLPAVAMDCDSGPREIIRDGIDGLLVQDGDGNAFAAALDQLMGNAGERERLATRAPDVLERFGSDKVLAQWEALLQRLVRA
jgi:GalNAc-alpha-(1->4)-GalNAc-alpha-(1->3)-diNAcBac-PP-undecaprenol alpha-1,4-N-acetyl-D-galactosaminyltransferase